MSPVEPIELTWFVGNDVAGSISNVVDNCATITWYGQGTNAGIIARHTNPCTGQFIQALKNVTLQ